MYRGSDYLLNMRLFLTRESYPVNVFRNHEFYGQKANVHMRQSVVQDGTGLSVGDGRVFLFLHVLRYTTDVPCDQKCFP